MPKASVKEERMYLRLGSDTKRKIEYAAALTGTTVTEFVVSTSKNQAERLIDDQEKILLSNRDRDLFLEAIANPPAPNAALRKAFKHFQGRTGSRRGVRKAS